MKSHLRALYREKMSQLTVPNDESFREITTSFFNLVLGSNIYAEKSIEYWEGPLKKKMLEKYELILSNMEIDMKIQVKNLLDDSLMVLLLKRLQKLMGIKFTKKCVKNFDCKDLLSSDFTFIISDVDFFLIDYLDFFKLFFNRLNQQTPKLNTSTSQTMQEVKKTIILK